MRHGYWIHLVCLAVALLSSCSYAEPPGTSAPTSPTGEEITVKLPEPRYDSDVSLEQSLQQRRSIRSFSDKPLTLQEVSQLLWAAQGITSPSGLRTAPSAGALYPLELYVVAGNVQPLPAGVYRYEPEGHRLTRIADGDRRAELADAALRQSCVQEGAAAFVFSAVYERTTAKYGDRGISYVHLEAGHAAQNLCLQATAIGLGAVTIGAFDDEQVSRHLNLPGNEQPLYIIPVGRP